MPEELRSGPSPGTFEDRQEELLRRAWTKATSRDPMVLPRRLYVVSAVLLLSSVFALRYFGYWILRDPNHIGYGVAKYVFLGGFLLMFVAGVDLLSRRSAARRLALVSIVMVTPYVGHQFASGFASELAPDESNPVAYAVGFAFPLALYAFCFYRVFRNHPPVVRASRQPNERPSGA